MFSSTIGSLVGYMMLSTDFLMTLSVNVGYGIPHVWRPLVVCCLGLGVMLPLSLLRTLASLAYVLRVVYSRAQAVPCWLV